ncbi:MAG: hypothetical protein WCH78_08825 [Bacteroidota bacterium]
MRNIAIVLFALVLFSSCSGNTKRIYIMSKGPAIYDEAAKTITAKDGNGHDEKIINISSAAVSLKLNGPTGEASLNLKENGLYILNIKTDTIIGSLQNYVSTNKQKEIMSQDELKVKIDSLQQLVAAKNISAAHHNFFILPNQAVKITDNYEAIIVGPFHQMTTAEKVDGKAPEVYRFYSIREIRETIKKLEAFTIATPAK